MGGGGGGYSVSAPARAAGSWWGLRALIAAGSRQGTGALSAPGCMYRKRGRGEKMKDNRV